MISVSENPSQILFFSSNQHHHNHRFVGKNAQFLQPNEAVIRKIKPNFVLRLMSAIAP